MMLGVLADTHDVLLPQVADLLAGCDRIIHAGDVCDPTIIAELSSIAPVTVVAGNNDVHPGWRETEVLEWQQRRILVHHIVAPERPSPQVREAIRRAAPELVIFGHTHRPYFNTIDNIVYLNPGAAGVRRSGIPLSLCRLRLHEQAFLPEFIPLER